MGASVADSVAEAGSARGARSVEHPTSSEPSTKLNDATGTDTKNPT